MHVNNMRNFILKLITLTVVFIAVVAVYFLTNIEKEVNEIEKQKEINLPYLHTIVSGEITNKLIGYTKDIKQQYIHGSITPLSEDRKLKLVINRQNNNIASISYEVRSKNGESLIERTNVESFEIKEDTINLELLLSNIIEKDVEYILTVKLVTELKGEVNYYSRVAVFSNEYYKSHIEFLKDFRKLTLDKSDDLVNYMNPLQNVNNNNLGYVTINSNFNQLTWGNLKVELMNSPQITIKDIIGNITNLIVEYQIKALNEYDTEQYFLVKEVVRLRTEGSSRIFVDLYDRKMEQIFDVNNQNISKTRINLGIDSDLEVKYETSPTGSYIGFVKNNSLYLMDMAENKVVDLFSFGGYSEKNIWSNSTNFDIDVVRVDAKGNVDFIVYGYMYKGQRAGEVGISYYRYKREDNSLKEIVFVPSKKPYEILKETINSMAYVSDDNVFYLMLDDSIYTITLDSYEYVQLVGGLSEGNYVISDDSTVIAWHENSSINEATSVRVIDIKNKKDEVIKAADDEYLKVAGFIDGDFVYGKAKKTDVKKDKAGETIFPMYELVIKIKDKEDESYTKKGIYIVDVIIETNMLRLKRVQKSSDGNYVSIAEEQLTNSEAEVNALVSKSKIITDLKKEELVLKFAYTVTNTNKINLIKPSKLEISTADTLANRKVTEENKYFAYSIEKLTGSYKDMADAINDAYNNMGVVINNKNEYIWARTSRKLFVENKNYTISIEDVNTPLELFEKYKSKGIPVIGATFDKLMYFLDDGKVILAINKDNQAEIIYGYKGTYITTTNTIYVKNPFTGEDYNKEYLKSIEEYSANDNQFIVIG